MAARAANVSAQLRRAGFILDSRATHAQRRPGTRIRVSQVGRGDVRVQVWTDDAHDLEGYRDMLYAQLKGLGYAVEISQSLDEPLYVALWVKRGN